MTKIVHEKNTSRGDLTRTPGLGYKIGAMTERERMKAPVTFSVNLPYTLKKEGSVYVTWCPALDVSSMGDSPEEAKRMLIEAVQLFLVSCHERGTLDRVLKDLGFQSLILKARAVQPAPRKNQISVPLPLDINRRLAACRA